MSKVRIYIVEDSSIVLENLVDAMVESAAIEVVGSAVDESSALAWLRAHPDGCDLVIVDIFLKSGTGIGVLRGMADVARAPERIVLSNHATPDVRAKCQQLGATTVFDKSNELEAMLAWLKRFVQSDRGAAALHS